MNNICIDGRLTSDCEIKQVGDSHVINFSIANDDENKKNQSGEYEKITSFFNVAYWSKSGKMATHLLKGKMVNVIGRLKQETWDNSETGKKNSKVIIKAFEVKPHVFEKAGESNQTFETGGQSVVSDDEVPF